MSRPDPDLAAAFEATWPAAETVRCGGFLVGRGAGAGGRVSSAIAVGPWTQADIDAACAQHAAWGQPPLFRAWDDEADLIAALSARSLAAHIPTLVMAAPVSALTDRPIPPVTAFAIWPPLAIQRQIWAAGNITPARQAVMDRVPLPKAALLGRIRDRAAGAGFVALHDRTAMVHAVEVLPAFRRQGLAGWMMRQAALWAQDLGATRIALAVSRANTTAQTTYASLGFTTAGSYAYYGPAA
ncbi:MULTISPECIES: GNAT family N-acetyltransferase [Paracoccus]|uniref:GNAT family N-acetyltransferase n=1 Tax=Paracoccus TaxID=265 RepID=UPI0008690F34|nr:MULTISPECIES: GNAT family N-acetyltransferase [Paracoccus]ODT60698.1 MAG: GNAT family N-acetyltransferase [Paracoccus sp. SCN 68-21]